jgi:hypothetical protein
VNDAYRLAPWADCLYACDAQWIHYWHKDVALTFGGECWTQDEKAARQYEWRHIKGEHRAGLGDEIIHFGANSGHQALNLAYIKGAGRLLLLGYDCQVNGKAHYFGDHPGAMQVVSPFKQMRQAFEQIKPAEYGITIINCTPGSAITNFPMGDVQDILA